ncbi:hypothetical protein CPB83DRAFT_941258 [Crepidotus variabilis]|uniref:Uncharacterized protein n=1 Tax=Crepidotus variabilis TaxID=179855 RepID=A0A9P6EBA7_9AGAR|nr:hypothetical protein CPB83DRAFT_941258 [Crepidotus variabilis]
MSSFDESVLDLIPTLFPDLTILAIQWIDGNKRFSLPWKDRYIFSLLKDKNLVELTLSNDFKQAASDPCRGDNQFAWLLRSYTRRLEGARLVCQSLTWLRQCNWLQVCVGANPTTTMLHPFNVEERPNSRTIDRVVRGLRQWWMGTNHEPFSGGEKIELTMAKLEFLPGEVIGEDYSDSERELDYDSDSDELQRNLRNL